jgi:nitrite reductase (NADH) large subunit
MQATVKERLVVVGNGMAALRTVEELLARAPDRYDLTIIGAEPYPNYNRILLSSVLAGEKTVDEIIINPLAWYAEREIRLIFGRPATAIDRAGKAVVIADGERVSYD